MLAAYYDYSPSLPCTTATSGTSETFPLSYMQGFLSYAMPRLPSISSPRQRLDPALENSSPTTPSSTTVVNPEAGYHYKKKNINIQTTTPSLRSAEPERDPSPKDTRHDTVTIEKTHKPNLSLSSFRGGAPMDTECSDPLPPRPDSGASTHDGSDLRQGPSQEHPVTGIQKKVDSLEPTNSLRRLRKTSSVMFLKLKIPRLKGSKLQKRKDSDAQSSALHTANLPLSSNSTVGLGRAETPRDNSIDSASPGTNEGSPSIPSRSATSMTFREEEESAPVPSRPATAPNSAYDHGPSIEDTFALPLEIVSSAFHSSEYRKSRPRRKHPTQSQDDISLNAHPVIDKQKSRRFSRRASLSAAVNLISFSEFRARSTSRTNSSSDSLKLDRSPNRKSNDTVFLTPAYPGNSEQKSSSVPSSSPTLKNSTEDLLTPTALVSTDMPFPSNDISLHHLQPPLRDSTSTPPSRAPSSDSGVSTSDMTFESSLYTASSMSSYPQMSKPTPLQLAQWRKDVEMIIASLDDEFEGEACLIRFEPKQGWFGFWNKESVSDVLDDLRGLRSPRS